MGPHQPTVLAQKLAVLVPPRRNNGVPYHGVLGPRHRLRNQVIPEPPEAELRERLTKKPAQGKSRWLAWADLFWRVFEVLGGPGCGLACVCGGRLVLHAVVRPPATLDVLNRLERSAHRVPVASRAYSDRLARAAANAAASASSSASILADICS